MTEISANSDIGISDLEKKWAERHGVAFDEPNDVLDNVFPPEECMTLSETSIGHSSYVKPFRSRSPEFYADSRAVVQSQIPSRFKRHAPKLFAAFAAGAALNLFTNRNN